MKKILNKHIHLSLMFCLTAICILFASCKREEIGSPVITSVRMYNASPMDTLMSIGNPKTDPMWSGGTGRYVAIIGQNLQNALSIKFDGVAAKYNNALFAPNSVVVPIPDIIFSTIDTTKLYTLEYVTTTGSTTFSFKLGPAAPTISAISDVFANPGDSVYVYGTNLVLVQSFSYGGATISLFKPSVYGTSLGFVMPSPAPTSGNVLVITKTGTAEFPIVALPTITGISNENANPGDSVFVYGTYLKSVQSFKFGGEDISSYKLSGNGKSIGFVLPSSVTAGPVTIATAFGIATTVYNVNDVKGIGSLTTCENGNNWQWWGGAGLYSGNPTSGWPSYNPDFPGNTTQYFVLKTNVLAPSEGNTYSNYTILLNAAQWVPAANINDPIANYAVKFEVSISSPWNGGALDIMSGDQTYIYRWEPWQKTATTTAAYSTKGWITVTVPFTEFRAKDVTLGEGRGVSMTKFADLVGASGNSKCTVYIHNPGTSATATGFYGAFDNIRVVKIK
jgi:hypothetical protein